MHSNYNTNLAIVMHWSKSYDCSLMPPSPESDLSYSKLGRLTSEAAKETERTVREDRKGLDQCQ